MRSLACASGRAPVRMLVALGALLTACGSGERPPVVAPVGNDGANLRLDQVIFTQGVQDDVGSLPLTTGAPASAKVLIVRSRESVAEVPVVLRLFRSGAIIHTDTARTGGVLGPTRSLAAAAAEFFIPAALVAPDVSWQVEIDPASRVPDSTRTDNTLPSSAPALLRTVNVGPIRLRLVPVVLARHGNLTGDLSATNAELYVRLARQIYPLGALSVSIGPPVTTQAEFGALPVGGDRSFWEPLLADVDRARTESGASDEYWYGVVPIPVGYTRFIFGGFAYLPSSPAASGPWSRSGAGADIRSSDAAFAQGTLAHELGHNFGRRHAPGCNVVPPIDSGFPNFTGSIDAFGHDVWSWASGFSKGAQSVGSQTADVMSYCAPKWIGVYTYKAVMEWRMATEILSRVAGTAGADDAHRHVRVAIP